MGTIAKEIDERIRSALQPSFLKVRNDSAKHHGHAGDNGSGESHFSVFVVAPAFDGMNRVQRQRAVYAALGDLMKTRVHALAITAAAPGEPLPGR